MDETYDDIAGMFDYMSVCCGKGVCIDTVSLRDLKEQYARKSSPALIAGFLHHCSAVHPELLEECTAYSEELPPGTVLYRIRTYEAFPDRKTLMSLVRSWRANNA